MTMTGAGFGASVGESYGLMYAIDPPQLPGTQHVRLRSE